MTDTPEAVVRHDHHLQPSIGEDSDALLGEAVASLGALRLPTRWLGDAGAELHLLASLIAETERRLPEVVAAARDQELSWGEIDDLLGTSRTAAWQRFGRQARTIQETTRRTLLAED